MLERARVGKGLQSAHWLCGRSALKRTCMHTRGREQITPLFQLGETMFKKYWPLSLAINENKSTGLRDSSSKIYIIFPAFTFYLPKGFVPFMWRVSSLKLQTLYRYFSLILTIIPWYESHIMEIILERVQKAPINFIYPGQMHRHSTGKWLPLGNDFLILSLKEISWQIAPNDLKLMIYLCNKQQLVCLAPSSTIPSTSAIMLPLGREDSQLMRRQTHSLKEH